MHMVLPHAVDAQIVGGDALAGKTGLFRRPERGEVAGHDVGFHPVKSQYPESPLGGIGDSLCAQTLLPKGAVDFIGQKAGLERAADNFI